MHEGPSVIFKFWGLDPIGTLAALILGLFVSGSQHVLRDSVTEKDGEIKLQDIQKTVNLLFSKHPSTLVVSLAVGTMAAVTMPLLCILMANRFGRHQIVTWKDGPKALETRATYVHYELKSSTSRRTRIVQTTFVFLTMLVLAVAGVSLAMCYQRLYELRETASELTDLARRRVEGAKDHLKKDLENAVAQLYKTVRETTLETSDMISSAKSDFSETTKSYWEPVMSSSDSTVAKCDETVKKIRAVLEDIDKFIPKANSLDLMVEGLQSFLRTVKEDVVKVDKQPANLVQNIDQVLDLRKSELANGIQPFVEKNKKLLQDLEDSKGSFPTDHINKIIEELRNFPSSLKDGAQNITEIIKSKGMSACESKEREFRKFAAKTDTMLLNDTSQRLKLWAGDVFSIVSTEIGSTIHAVLLTASVVSLLLAVTIAAGMAAGIAFTRCYSNCNPAGYTTSLASSWAANAMVAGVYAASLLLWAYLLLTLAGFLVGVYHVDTCSSYRDKDVLDFPISTVVSFADNEAIDMNRTGKGVIETCESTRNIMEAVGRTDLLMFNHSYFHDIKVDFSAMESQLNDAVRSIEKVDISRINRAADLVQNIRTTLDAYNKDLERESGKGIAYSDEYQTKFAKITNDIESALKSMRRDPFHGYANQVTPKHNDIVFAIYAIQGMIYDITTKYKTVKTTTMAITKLFQECEERSKKLNDFIGPKASSHLMGVMSDVSKDQVHEFLHALHDVLQGRGVDHGACKTLQLAYEQTTQFTCHHFLNAVSTSWLNLLAATVTLALGIWAAIPAVYLVKMDKLMLDVLLPTHSHPPRTIEAGQQSAVAQEAHGRGEEGPPEAASDQKTNRPRTA